MKRLVTIFPLLACVISSALAADFVVTNMNSSGPGSLSQAITDANAVPGRDNILFNIQGAGVHVIDASTALPEVTDPVIIDGYTQPGAQPNTRAVGDNAVILIEINTPPSDSDTDGLLISAGTSIVRGLSITGFNRSGIQLAGPGTGNTIEGNFIGLRPDGTTAVASNRGIHVGTTGNMIGGTTPSARNVISGVGDPASTGVFVQGNQNTVSGNYIGTDASGMVPCAHNIGVLVFPGIGDVVIGGTTAGAGNVISGTFAAVQVLSVRTQIQGNYIGIASDGKTPLKNNGIGVYVGGGNNTIGGLAAGAGNAIAFSGRAGVWLWPSDGTRIINDAILSNSIYGRGPGIKLGDDGPHLNDNLDADEGANHLQNFPIITSLTYMSDTYLVEGTLNSTPNTQFTIQLFGDGTDYLNPTRTFLRTITVTTDNNGNAPFSTAVPAGPGDVDATATDPPGNTSEFFLRPSKSRNLSTRARVEPGDNALIGGIIADGFFKTGSKIIVRALGPSLAVNGSPIAGRLQDPVLEIYGKNGRIATNDNWGDDPNTASELQKYGLVPTDERESAAQIDPGAGGIFTAVVRGKNNSSGIAVVEFYDVTGTSMHLVNVSSRGLVQSGDNVIVGGFIAADGNGQFPFVLRALGPSLSQFGVTNPLPDPQLELHDANGDTLATSDNWREDPVQESYVNAAGLGPSDPKEAAMLMMLPPGAYTAIVRGNDGGTGVALIEIYQLP
jgi:hypothetical protein